MGSSPRVRGRPIQDDVVQAGLGLIPACAGQTGRHSFAPLDGRGSSPRVRGRRPGGVSVGGCSGLIPACAGQTGRSSRCAWRGWAHPRVCGADCARRQRPALPSGSSPRVRGRPQRIRRAGGCGRLIPACAGQTPGSSTAANRSRAHPRVCGADSPSAEMDRVCSGSSPRVRGRQPVRPRNRQLRGLIPACAGQTSTFRRGHRPVRAHPRVCGADGFTGVDASGSPGSSPRVRGRPPHAPQPARRHRAHPRVCGADPQGKRHKKGTPGSSPRVRGRHPTRAQSARAFRLIPACAGQTVDVHCASCRVGAHPRVCGADRLALSACFVLLGSSPRVRGRHLATSDVA